MKLDLREVYNLIYIKKKNKSKIVFKIRYRIDKY